LGFYSNSCFTSGEELIHRLNRQLGEPASAFNLVLLLWPSGKGDPIGSYV